MPGLLSSSSAWRHNSNGARARCASACATTPGPVSNTSFRRVRVATSATPTVHLHLQMQCTCTRFSIFCCFSRSVVIASGHQILVLPGVFTQHGHRTCLRTGTALDSLYPLYQPAIASTLSLTIISSITTTTSTSAIATGSASIVITH